MAYKLCINDAAIMETPETNPLTVDTVLTPNLSLSGVATIAIWKKIINVIRKAD